MFTDPKSIYESAYALTAGRLTQFAATKGIQIHFQVQVPGFALLSRTRLAATSANINAIWAAVPRNMSYPHYVSPWAHLILSGSVVSHLQPVDALVTGEQWNSLPN